jgi:hypothetical protein
MKRTGLMIIGLGFFFFTQAAQADWTPAKRLTWNSGISQYPAIALDSLGRLHVVWSDDTPGNKEIYYKKSTDGGTTWLPNQRLTWNSGGSKWPAIAIDSSDNLHIVWEDTTLTPGNGEIYYRQSTDGGPHGHRAKDSPGLRTSPNGPP